MGNQKFITCTRVVFSLTNDRNGTPHNRRICNYKMLLATGFSALFMTCTSVRILPIMLQLCFILEPKLQYFSAYLQYFTSSRSIDPPQIFGLLENHICLENDKLNLYPPPTAVWNQWNGMVEWNSGMQYWNDGMTFYP